MSAVREWQARGAERVEQEAASARAVVAALLEGLDPLLVEMRDSGAVVIELEDVVPDEAGEAVLLHGGDARRLVVLASRAVEESGRAVPHITAAGENVSGMRYVRFAGGPVLYYPAPLELEIVRLQ